jgi:xylulokinase
MTKSQGNLIGIDVGTTAVKAALFDTKGHVLKSFAELYPTQRPAPNCVEQNPQDWERLILKALAHVSEAAPRDAIRAIGLCSQVNTHVFVGENGEPLLPAFTWADTRCAEVAAYLDAQVRAEDKLRWWGAPLPIDASHVLARMAHVKQHLPEVWSRTRWVMAPKDFCIFKLTGEVTADPMTCFGIVDQDLKLIRPLLDLVPGAEKRLPTISGFTTSAGKTAQGVAVVVGAMDAWSGLLGSGVSEEGQGLYLSGTSEILGLVSKQKVPTPGVIAFADCEGISLHAAPTQSGGASVEWMARLLNTSAIGISEFAAKADIKNTPLFLPHLEGERAPLWDSASRGAFAGLSSAAGAPEMARAVLEGVAYSASDLWCQIRADVLGRRLQRTTMRDAGVLGAALMAGVGIGLFNSLQQAAKDFVLYDRAFQPDPKASQRHAERFVGYKTLYEQLKPLRGLWNS